MTRAEHVAWCKERALVYARADDLTQAVTSMASDLSQHPEVDPMLISTMVMIGLHDALRGDRAAVIRWIEGFN